MKKSNVIFKMLLFFLCITFSLCFFQMEKTNLKTTQTKTQNIETQKNTGFCFEFEYDSKKFKFNDTDFEKTNLSENQKNIKKNATEFDTIKKLEKMGFSKKEAICYVFPEIKNILNKLKIAIECKEEPDTVSVVSNSCRLVFE